MALCYDKSFSVSLGDVIHVAATSHKPHPLYFTSLKYEKAYTNIFILFPTYMYMLKVRIIQLYRIITIIILINHFVELAF